MKEAQLTSFINDVINDTMEAIISAKVDQERQYCDLFDDLTLSPNEFISKYHLKESLSLIIREEDKINLDQVLLELYERRIRILKQILNDGPPKLTINSGSFKVKVAFTRDDNVDNEDLYGKGRFLPDKADPSTIKNECDSLDLESSIKNIAESKIDCFLAQKQVLRSGNRKVKVILPDYKLNKDDPSCMYGEIEVNFSVE